MQLTETKGIEEALLHRLLGDAAAIVVDVAMIGKRVETGARRAHIARAGSGPRADRVGILARVEDLRKGECLAEEANGREDEEARMHVGGVDG